MGRFAGSSRQRGWPSVVLAGALLVLFGAVASVEARASKGELRVTIAGLPRGTKARVLLREPSGAVKVLRQGTVLRGVRPGTYRLHVLEVRLKRGRAGLPRGGMAYPAVDSRSVVVHPGAVSRARILYGTVQSAVARRLGMVPLQVGGNPANPRWIKVPRSVAHRRGTVLVAKPNRALPDGLFHVVTRVRPSGKSVLLSLDPARVSQVYPSLYLNGPLGLSGTGDAGGSVPSLWSLSDQSSGCAAQQTGYSSTISLHPSFVAKRFYVHNGSATGNLVTGLSGSVNVNLPVGTTSTCAARPESSAWRGFLRVAGSVPIPYYVQPSFVSDWQASAGFTLQTSGSVSIIAGMKFARSHVRPLFRGSSQLATSLSHEGDVNVSSGIAARWGLGLPQATMAYVQVSPTAFGQTGPCVAGDQVRLQGGLPGDAVSHNYRLSSQPCDEYTLTMASTGNGLGSVTSNPGGVGCNSSCSVKLDGGTRVTVTADPASGSSFAGWSGGGCAGTGPCTMTLSQDSTVTATFAAGDPSASARNQLTTLLQNATQATGLVKEPTDGTGHTVDTLTPIASPAGGYLGIYHALVNGSFQVRLATSPDLLHWTYKTTLDQSASQPAIAQLSDGSFLVVDEKSSGNGTSHLHFVGYANLSALEAGSPAASYDAPLTISSTHEGTPNIRSVALTGGLSESQIEVGFHYYDRGAGGDREGVGTLTNFSSWAAEPENTLNNSFSPIPDNVGDRYFISFEGYPFTIVEAQLSANDWTTWRVFLYDETAQTLTSLNVVTPGGSRSFANPAVSTMTDPAGHRALVVSYFLPYQGAAPGEAGPLIFYTDY